MKAKIAITGGTVNNAAIGGTTPAALTCTTLQVNTSTDFQGNRLVNIGAPVAVGDAASKLYVDNLVQGLVIRESCRLATTAPLPGTRNANIITENANASPGALSIDGVVVAGGDRILVKNQTSGVDNGIYTVTNIGNSAKWVLTRATDVDTTAEVQRGMLVPILGAGTTNGNTYWALTDAQSVVVNTGAQTFTAFGGSTVTLTSSGSTIDISTYDIDVDESHAFAWTGAQTFSAGGAITFNAGAGNLSLVDNIQLRLGTGNDVTHTFNGTDYLITHAGSAGADHVIKLASATVGSEYRIDAQDNTVLFEVKGDGYTRFSTQTETVTANAYGTFPAAARYILLNGTAATGDTTGTLSAPTESGQVVTIAYVADGAGTEKVTLTINNFITPTGGAASNTDIIFDNQGQSLTLVSSGTAWMNANGGHS